MKINKILAVACALLTVSCHRTDRVKPAIPADREMEKKIEEVLSGMTLDEKVGQMLQLNLDVLGKKGVKPWQLDEYTLDTLIRNWKVGSFLNVAGRAATVDEWQERIGKIQEYSLKYIGIPTIYGLDQNHGASYTQGSVIFPQPINVAATFDTDVVFDMARTTAYESRACNCPWVFNPTLDLGRDPRWSRIWESFGEDAVVNSRMAQAEVRGYQGDDNNHLGSKNVAVSVKHYFGYGAPFSGKDRTPAYISPQMLREKYFAPFKAAIEAGALTVMVNSGSINGVPVHSSYEYLTEWLKEDLNWDGMIVTDWADINSLYKREKVAKDKKDAIRIAINAGIDMSMDPYSVDFCVLLKELVEEGEVKMERIDDAVRRILRLKFRLGLFDCPNTPAADYPDFASEEHVALARRAALESEVLLKNNGILPLKAGLKLLVTGPNANQMRCLNGGWTYTWQGKNAEDLSEPYNTIYEALSNRFGAANVILEQGVTYNEKGAYWKENKPEIEKAVRAAARADVIVACIGENSYCETPGNLTDLTLSENQRNLVKALAKTGKPMVFVLNEGRPRLVADIEPLASAVVDVLLPGNYGGDALAALLAGDENFSARLPYTYPKEINSLITYDYKVSEQVNTMSGAYDYDARVTQQWPFGYGLSYTTFEYSPLRLAETTFAAGDVLHFEIDVRNTGNRAGKEIVLLYSSDLVASLTPDCRRLRDFKKVELQPGESRTVSFELPADDLAFVGADGRWVLEPGDFRFSVGTQGTLATCIQK